MVPHGWKKALPGRDLSATLTPAVSCSKLQTAVVVEEAVTQASKEPMVAGYNLKYEGVKELINTEDVNLAEVIQNGNFEERDGDPADEVEKGDLTTQQLTNALALIKNVNVLLAESDGDEFQQNKCIENFIKSLSEYKELLNECNNAHKHSLITNPILPRNQYDHML